MNFYMDGTGIFDVSVFAVTGRKTADVEKSSFAGIDVQEGRIQWLCVATKFLYRT